MSKPRSITKIAMEKRNAEIVTLYTEGKKEIKELSDEFGLSNVFISGILNKHGVKKRKNSSYA
jgi:Mor family transcriptional regulator